MCNQTYIYALAIGLAILLSYMIFGGTKENYRDPIYLNRRKYLCDYYPRSNGSIYGEQSHVLSGFPYYPKAY